MRKWIISGDDALLMQLGWY